MKLFVIPTHRICEKAVVSLLKEIEKAYGYDETVKIAILDNSNSDTFRQNQDFLNKLKEEKKELHLYHIGLDDMLHIVEELGIHCDLTEDELKEMLYPDKIDYGKIANMIYITTLLLSENGFHRRDSDCFVFGLDSDKYPVLIEKEYLGVNANDASGLVRQEQLEYVKDEKICIVGGDYTGNWDLDTQRVNEANPDAMRYMMQICGIPDEDISEQFSIKYEESESIESTEPVLSSLFEVSQSPECGNISMYDVFRYVPNFIGENGIGFDNHTYWMAFNVKTPVVFHYNRIEHIHDDNRNKDIVPLRYWIGIAKMVDFDCYHLAFLNAGCDKQLCKDTFGTAVLKQKNADELPDLWEKIFSQLNYKERVKRIEVIADNILRPTNIKEYVQIADYLLKEKENIVKQLDYEYTLSIKLQRNWHKIVKAADKISRQTDSFLNEV